MQRGDYMVLLYMLVVQIVVKRLDYGDFHDLLREK